MITLGCRDPEKGISDSKYAEPNGKEELVQVHNKDFDFFRFGK